MTFYLNPPSGNISLQHLEKFARTRLDFLLKITSCGGDKLKLQDTVTDFLTVAESDCLLDGSTKDVVSHFILRLILCQDHDTKGFLLKAESQLFKFRFQCMSEDELTKSLKKADSHLQKVQHNYLIPSALDFEKLKHIRDIFRKITATEPRWKLIVQKYLSGDNKDGFWIPFFVVHQLVAKRRVELENGLAFVPFCKLEDVISNLWYQLLVWGVDRTCRVQTSFLQDKRMRSLTRHIQALFRKHHGIFEDGPQIDANLSHDQVPEVMTLFPPCMSHVHHILTTRHRLQHHARIQYTLFLKENGMPVHEALMFWRKEYLKPTNANDNCSHSWQQDGRRYTYNIRHLYGLEGACTNYRGHCCTTLQNAASGFGEQGGCPFRCFDSNHLDLLLQREEIVHSRETIKQLSADGKYSEACRSLFVEKSKKLIQKMEDQCKAEPVVTRSGNREYCMVINKGHKVMNSAASLTFDLGSSEVHSIRIPERSSIATCAGHSCVSKMWSNSLGDTNCNSGFDMPCAGTDSHMVETLSERTDVIITSLPACTHARLGSSPPTCSQKEEARIREGEDQDDDVFLKPSQYYFSLRKLVEGLKTTCK
ncbi:DNA primase large subunit-like [Mizuhopecten yessoensis]|uniref:DNA primase large subunit-like n=1 Tax=Mizuhopecten yessoensis TaxID=6573 RepID=UPI000B459DFF|nr:DNA primase large subunit-like [Mizuhopecten yessoensis]